RFYQRLLALDQDGASEIIEAALKERPRAEVFDAILIPALSRAERDAARGEIDERERAFVWRVIREILRELEGTEEIDLGTAAVLSAQPDRAIPASAVLGIAANDHADALVLAMLRLLLDSAGCPMEVVTDVDSPLALSEAVGERSPRLLLLSHLPPEG